MLRVWRITFQHVRLFAAKVSKYYTFKEQPSRIGHFIFSEFSEVYQYLCWYVSASKSARYASDREVG